ncbi:DUF5694 domain-containing protein [Paucibacter sp. R3-3]|uniref:DUF5694 domain-containing protein n=1 Tax=Roseateles agri TaxID=3098619 RepID=A0ABU5DIE1_9BURK|nr:DUF5694 domain-containing protein [Paucibacter sp. R3-3]MDY0746061.1 DUF5694 domain-containing protein [Paucibacter sp. R3-3]
MPRWMRRLLPLAALLPLATHAQVDLGALDREMVGPRAHVLVLGTVHLSELPDDFDPAALDGLLDRLAAFRPEVITIEALPGEECDLAERLPTRYGSDYCASREVAAHATGLDLPAAIAAVDKTLASWPAQPTPAQRRHLAALFLAASDRASAYAQWLQLPAAERHPGDGLEPSLVELIGQIATRRNENYLIASKLAARLGLPRVYACDNHTGDNVDADHVKDEKAFGSAIEAAWKAGRAELDRREQATAAMKRASDLLPLYRTINRSDYLRVTAEVNVSAALRARSAEGYPQMWVAGWEIRNLRMIANLREAFRERPGARVLSIVGASHKPWFDDGLGRMQGVDIVDVADVLK